MNVSKLVEEVRKAAAAEIEVPPLPRAPDPYYISRAEFEALRESFQRQLDALRIDEKRRP